MLSDLGAIERLYNAHHVAATPKDAVCLAIRSGVDMQFYDFRSRCLSKRADRLRARGLARASGPRLAQCAPFCASSSSLASSTIPTSIPSLNAAVHRSQAHLDVSLQSARESMTLLKNDESCFRFRSQRGALPSSVPTRMWPATATTSANPTGSASACSKGFARPAAVTHPSPSPTATTFPQRWRRRRPQTWPFLAWANARASPARASIAPISICPAIRSTAGGRRRHRQARRACARERPPAHHCLG